MNTTISLDELNNKIATTVDKLAGDSTIGVQLATEEMVLPQVIQYYFPDFKLAYSDVVNSELSMLFHHTSGRELAIIADKKNFKSPIKAEDIKEIERIREISKKITNLETKYKIRLVFTDDTDNPEVISITTKMFREPLVHICCELNNEEMLEILESVEKALVYLVPVLSDSIDIGIIDVHQIRHINTNYLLFDIVDYDNDDESLMAGYKIINTETKSSVTDEGLFRKIYNQYRRTGGK